MFLVNSRLGLFTAPRRSGDPFFRRYGANLPSSLTRFLLRASVFSTILPVSVYDTVGLQLKLRSFSWQHGIVELPLSVDSVRVRVSELARSIQPSLPTHLDGYIQQSRFD